MIAVTVDHLVETRFRPGGPPGPGRAPGLARLVRRLTDDGAEMSIDGIKAWLTELPFSEPPPLPSLCLKSRPAPIQRGQRPVKGFFWPAREPLDLG